MSAPTDPAGFKEAMIVLAAAGVVVPLVHRLRISPILGFMVVGMVVGPFGLGSLTALLPWLDAISITRPQSIELVAELGVVLLMFMIGLEMAFERLRLLARFVFGLGPLQIAVSTALLAGALHLVGSPPGATLAVGLALAMSSTAIVIQVLSDGHKLNAPLGRISFAILLMQDIAVVPVLFVLTSLGDAEKLSLWGFGLMVGKALATVAAILAIARLALRPLFRVVARTNAQESFIAASLLVILATGLATAAAGMSMPIGALLAGLLLAETEYRRQIEVTIEPFKGLLLGVFLLSVGMTLDLRAIVAAPLLTLVGAVALVAIKCAIVTLLVRGFGHSWRLGLQTGLLLGPGGEFGFVILSLVRSGGLAPAELIDPALVMTALSMAAIPLLFRLGRRWEASRPIDPALLPPALTEGPDPVLIAGFGRVGQTVAAMLERHKIPYLALDLDPDRIARLRAEGKNVYYGNIANPAMLQHLNLARARGLVVTLDERRAADALVHAARAEQPNLLIVARARDAGHAAELYAAGVTDAVAETIEASLQLAEAALVDLGVPMGHVIASVHEQREEFQAEIRTHAPDVMIRPLGRRRFSARRAGSP